MPTVRFLSCAMLAAVQEAMGTFGEEEFNNAMEDGSQQGEDGLDLQVSLGRRRRRGGGGGGGGGRKGRGRFGRTGCPNS